MPTIRGPLGVTVSVRFGAPTEVWLYAAEFNREDSRRGLWRWRQGRWETLSGGSLLGPRTIVQELVQKPRWVRAPPPALREHVMDLLTQAAGGS